MKLFQKPGRVLTPMLLTTLVLAHAVWTEPAQANENDRRSRRGERRNPPNPGGEIPGGEGGIQDDFRENDRWARDYIGRRSIHLTDDAEYVEKVEVAQNLKTQFKRDRQALLKAKKNLKTAQGKRDKIQKKINKLSDATLKAVAEKKRWQDSLPGLRTQLEGLKTQVRLAKAAAEGTSQNLQKAQQRVQKIQEKLNTTETTCTASPTPQCQKKVEKLKNRLAQAKVNVQDKRELNKAAQTDLKAKKKKRAAKRKKIAKAEARIQAIDTENGQRAVKLAEAQAQLVQANNTVAAEENTLRPIRQTFRRSKAKTLAVIQARNKYRRALTERIQRLNSLGAEVGREDGRLDGHYYAKFIGVEAGQPDGDHDGRSAGTQEGRRRSFERGFGQGEIEGRAEAEERGLLVGTREGRQQGNIDAATAEGRAAGIERANQSDAAQVGSRQGEQAGMTRAIREGRIAGTAQGEAQAINDFEARSLPRVESQGTFIGAFAPRIPSYPGFNCVNGRRYREDDHRWRRFNDYRVDRQLCPNFTPRRHPRLRNKKRIFKKAFADGYLRRYRQGRRRQFVRHIDSIYLNAYNATYDAAYADYSSREYSEDLQRGRSDGHSSAYNAHYPRVYDRHFRSTREQYAQNPERQSEEYTSTFSRVEGDSYARRYEKIRRANYNREENQTFDQNIAAQTEKFRKIRHTEVSSIYQNHPVLKFESSQMLDGGLQGIAAQDGVYQPQETTYHHVIITNFGQREAKGVRVVMENGQNFTLPDLPASSQVVIKGAAQSQVQASLGKRHQSTLSAYSTLTAEKKIQGRHFYNQAQGMLNRGDVKTVRVQYPLSLSGLSTQSELLIHQANKLNITLSNHSKRAYSGPLTIELLGDTHLIRKGFGKVQSLKGNLKIDDAQILVAQESDVFTPLAFDAVIKKQGITLGVLKGVYRTMAKAPYAEKAQKPVVVVNSDSSSRELLDLLSDLGGISEASVLDLSLASLNRSVLTQGLKAKTALVLDDGKGSTMSGLQSLLAQSQDLAILFVDNHNQGLALAKQTAALKDKVSFSVKLKALQGKKLRLTFTNNLRANLKDMSVLIQSDRRSFKELLSTAKVMTLTADEMVAQAAQEINKTSYFTSNETLQSIIAKSLGEIMVVSRAYKKEGSSSQYEDLIYHGKDMIFQKMNDAAKGKSTDKNINHQLAGIGLYYSIEQAMDYVKEIYKPLAKKIESKVQKRLRDVMKGKPGFLGIRSKGLLSRKGLRKYNQALYSKVKKQENQLIHYPFEITNTQTNHHWNDNH